MPFEIPDNIHENTARLAWLLGTWEGSGKGDYPTIEPFEFRQRIIFQQDGRPFFHYMSTSELVDAEGNVIRPAAQETGYLRPQPDGTIEWVMAHNTGIVEIWHGQLHEEQPRFEIVTDAVARTATAQDYTGGNRADGYADGDLMYAFDMAAMGQELQPHLWAQLKRA